MLIYGTPSSQTSQSRPLGTVSVQRARRAIAAAKHSAGWVRKSYLQSAIEHLSDVEYALSRTGNPEVVKALVETTIEFYAVASEDELESAVAQVIRSYGVELDVAEAIQSQPLSELLGDF